MFGVLPWGASSFATKTAEEIVETAEQSGSILVVPVGSIEQHGIHLPVATDTILVSEVVTETADRLVEDEGFPLLVVPPIWSGYSPHHLSFGGTLTGEFDTLLTLIEELAVSGLENGFDAVLLVNGHGGNVPLIDAAVSTIGRDTSDTEVLGLTYFELAASSADSIRESEAGGMGHGGEFETSLMMHLHPDLVREDKTGPYLEEHYDHGMDDLLAGGALTVYRPFGAYSDSGAIGDPGLATAEKGRQFLEGIVDELATILTDIYEHNR